MLRFNSQAGFTLQGGFTLIEVIVSIVLIGIVGVVSLGFLTNLIQTNQDSSGQLEVLEDVNTALLFMSRELRQVDEFSWPIRCGNPAVACVPNTAYPRIQFSKDAEVPLDPARRDTNTDDIVYNLNGTTLERISNGITTTLATNVQTFSITEIPNPGAPTTPTGLFQLVLTISRPSTDPGTNYNFVGTTAVQIRNRLSSPLNVAFVVDNPGSLHSEREVDYNNHLQNVLGHAVTLINDGDAINTWTPTNFDVVIISGDTDEDDPTPVGLSGVAVSIITLHSKDVDNFSLGTDEDRNGEEVVATVQIANHFITRVFGLGNFAFDDGVAVNTPDRGYIEGFADDANSEVTSLISYASAARSKLLVVQNGGTLATGGTAPARRAYLGMREYREGGRVLNNNGLKLFNRTLAWAAGLD